MFAAHFPLELRTQLDVEPADVTMPLLLWLPGFLSLIIEFLTSEVNFRIAPRGEIFPEACSSSNWVLSISWIFIVIFIDPVNYREIKSVLWRLFFWSLIPNVEKWTSSRHGRLWSESLLPSWLVPCSILGSFYDRIRLYLIHPVHALYTVWNQNEAFQP